MEYFKPYHISGIVHRVAAFLFLSCFLFSSTIAQTSEEIAQNIRKAEDEHRQKVLSQNIEQANKLWGQKKANLKLAATLLKNATAHNAKHYYGLASHFYLWSLKNSDIEEDFSAIESDAKRIIPLLPREEQRKWESYIENKDPAIVNELYGFWITNDPYATTKINERLIEHWQRIYYARKNFTRAKHSPYHTDDRGIYYVKLGAPDKITRKSIHLNQVVDPEGERVFYFELGNVVRSEVEIWEYREFGDDFFLLFGKHNGWGEFGLRKSITELFDINGLRVQLRGAGFIPDHRLRDLSKKVAQLGIFEQLAPYHPFFETMYSHMKTSLSANTFGSSTVEKYLKSAFYTEALVFHHLHRNIASAPSSKTNIVADNNVLTTSSEVYRFLSPDEENQFIIAVQPKPKSEDLRLKSPIFLSNRIAAYDDNWDEVTKIDDPKVVNKELLATPSLYIVEEPLNEFDLYFSSELIDTTFNGIYIPGKISPKASAIVATSGKQKLQLPDRLDRQDTLLVSDIVLGPEQSIDDSARLPITPSIDRTYKPGTNLMVYFEAYNIPDGGYSFEYYFEKHRWLFKNKRLDEKPSITVINERISTKRNKQLFSISLSDLDEGTYDLVFEFRPLTEDGKTAELQTRRVELKVSDET